MFTALIVYYCLFLAALSAIVLPVWARSLRPATDGTLDGWFQKARLVMSALTLGVLAFVIFRLLLALGQNQAWAAVVLAMLGALLGGAATDRCLRHERETGRKTHWRAALGLTTVTFLSAGTAMV